jgi:large subunit ribosomal protein L4
MSEAIDPTSFHDRVSVPLLHQAILMYRSNLRVGTARTKTRAEVVGSKKKMYRQKGTGRARAGNRRTPVRVGGGHAFAKQPRDWTYRLPRRSLQIATRMALRAKAEAGGLVIVDSLALTEYRTKQVVAKLTELGIKTETCLLVTDELQHKLVRSARNLTNVTVSRASDINAYEILKVRRVVIERQAVQRFQATSAQ